MKAMYRIIAFLLLFVSLSATPGAMMMHGQHIVHTDTVVTTEVVKRTEIINRIEEVVFIDTIYDSKGNRRVVRRDSVISFPILSPEVLLESKPQDNRLEKPSDSEVGGSVITSGVDEVAAKPEVIYVETVRSDTIWATPSHMLEPADGGQYLWIPDSMARNVRILLSGHSNLIDDEARIDHNERVTFRGDTIPMVLRDRNLGRYNRGLFNYLYIPKGIWQLGITASYGEFSTKDLEIFDLLSDIDFHGKMFSIQPYFSYFFGNNMSAGMRLGYSYGRANVDSFNVDIDSDMSFNLHDIMYRSENYTAAFTFNQYFGITRRGRFGIFNEVELALSGGTTDFIRPYNSELKHTHTTTMQAALNFSPGVSVFVMEQVSFNVSFGVFGFSLKNEKQTVDGEKMGSRFTSGANFRFNIFNINFGIAVNI